MERNYISTLALAIGSLLLSSCGEAGRYQMVVTPPYEGESRTFRTQCYVLDTKTGEVFTRYSNEKEMSQWDPHNKTLKYDSLTVTINL